MSQKDIEERFMSTFKSTSTVSRDQSKFETTPRNLLTQNSFYSPNNIMNYSNYIRDKSKTYSSRLQCNCPKRFINFQKGGLRCTCHRNQKNLLNEMGKRNLRTEQNRAFSKYNRINNKSEIGNIREEKIENIENSKKSDNLSHSAGKKVCTCRKRFQMPNISNSNLDISLNQILPEKGNKNYYSLLSGSKLSSEYVQNNSFYQSIESVKILVPIHPNEIDYNYRLEIPGIYSKEIKNEKKEKEKKEIDKKEEIEKENNIQNEEIIEKEHKEEPLENKENIENEEEKEEEKENIEKMKKRKKRKR